MQDKVFIDTNVLIYFISDDIKKKIKAKEVLFSRGEPVISSQVINEFINACLTKNLLKLDKIISLSTKFIVWRHPITYFRKRKKALLNVDMF